MGARSQVYWLIICSKAKPLPSALTKLIYPSTHPRIYNGRLDKKSEGQPWRLQWLVNVNLPANRQTMPMPFLTLTVVPRNYKKSTCNGNGFGGQKVTAGFGCGSPRKQSKRWKTRAFQPLQKKQASISASFESSFYGLIHSGRKIAARWARVFLYIVSQFKLVDEEYSCLF